MLQLRNAGVVVDDPLLTEYIEHARLAARDATPTTASSNFNFFVVKDDQHQRVRAARRLHRRELRLASRERQRERARRACWRTRSRTSRSGTSRAPRTTISATASMSMAAMLAALVLGAASDMSSDAMQGVVTASQALAAQRQINFTRSNEHEADRVGIELLSGAGFDPNGMSSFFEKLGQAATAARRSTCPRSCRRTPSRPNASPKRASARASCRPTTHTEQPGLYAREGALDGAERADARSGVRAFRDKARQHARRATATVSRSLDADVAQRQRRALFRELIDGLPNTMAFRVGQAEALVASGATERALEGLRGRDPPVPAQRAADDQLRRNADRGRQTRRGARAAARPAEQRRPDAGAAAAADRARRERRRRRRRTPTSTCRTTTPRSAICRSRSARCAWRSKRRTCNDVDRARFRSRLDQLIEYLPDEQRELATTTGPQ